MRGHISDFLFLLLITTLVSHGCMRQKISSTNGIIGDDGSVATEEIPDWLMTLRDGKTGQDFCTAYAATPWQIVTAAHCVYGRDWQSFQMAPFKGQAVGVKSIRYKSGLDVAIIEPSHPYFYAAPLDYLQPQESVEGQSSFSVLWRSSSRAGWFYSGGGSVIKATEERKYYHDLDTLPGASGAPIVARSKTGHLKIFGIHLGFDKNSQMNIAARLDGDFLFDTKTDGKPAIDYSYQAENGICRVAVGRTETHIIYTFLPCPTEDGTGTGGNSDTAGDGTGFGGNQDGPSTQTVEPIEYTESGTDWGEGPVDAPVDTPVSTNEGEIHLPSPEAGENSEESSPWPLPVSPIPGPSTVSPGDGVDFNPILPSGGGDASGCFGCAIGNSDFGSSTQPPEVDCTGDSAESGSIGSDEVDKKSAERQTQLDSDLKGKDTVGQKGEFDGSKSNAMNSVGKNSGTADKKPGRTKQNGRTEGATDGRQGQQGTRKVESPIGRVGEMVGDIGLSIGQAAEKFVGYLKGELGKLTQSLEALPDGQKKTMKAKGAAIAKASIKSAEQKYKEGRYAEGNQKVRLAIKGLGIAGDSAEILENIRFSWPFAGGEGRVTSKMRPKRFHPVLKKIKAHKGTDFGMPKGSNIISIGSGVVVKSYYHQDFGNQVVVASSIDGKNVLIKYAHLTKRSVSVGDIVGSSDNIGTVGSTGELCDGPHLHLEVREVDNFENIESDEFNGTVLDPETYIHRE